MDIIFPGNCAIRRRARARYNIERCVWLFLVSEVIRETEPDRVLRLEEAGVAIEQVGAVKIERGQPSRAETLAEGPSAAG